MTYQLDGPALPNGELVKTLQNDFPGIRRYLHKSYIRYSFDRYGVTYVAAIYCLDTRPRSKILTCKQADQIMDRFLRALKLAGGSPSASLTVDALRLDRPKKKSKDFTYFSPGPHPQYGIEERCWGTQRLHGLCAAAVSAQRASRLPQFAIVQQLG